MHDKISIIIPVYNVADYLREALDSVLNQTYTNWEAICVNDGSTDNSLEILKEYAQKDSRFIIIDQENGGVSKARNIGLDNASGKYVMFLDPDDYFYPYTCEKAYQNIIEKNSDITIFGHDDLINGELIASYKNVRLRDISNGISPKNYSLFVTVCMKIFKKSFLDNNGLRFFEHQDISEDMMFSYFTLFNNPIISVTEKSLYVYRRNRENSLTTGNVNGIKSEIQAAEFMVKNTMFNNAPEEIKLNFVEECFRNCLYYFYKFTSLDKQIITFFDSLKMLNFWEKRYDRKFLEKIDEYRQVKMMHKKIWYNFIKILFPAKKYSEDFGTFLSEVKFEKSIKLIKQKIGKKRIILYGAGSFLEYILKHYDFSELNIIGISDLKFAEKKEKQMVLGYNVIPKDKIVECNPDYVLISAKNYENILSDFKLNMFKKTKIKVLPLVKKT